MSDYLERLVARSRGDLTSVRPRLPNRFEDLSPDELEGAEGADLGATELRATEELVETASREELDRPSLPEQSPRGEPMTSMPPDGPDPARLSSPPVDSTRNPVDMPDLPAPTFAPPEAFPTEHPVGDTLIPERGSLEPIPPTTISTSEEPSPQHQHVTPTMSPEIDDQPRPTLEAPTVTNITVNEATSPEPTVVEVRIGRIDIQAAPPTTTSAPPRRPPRPARTPQVSLDDYLRRRREG